MAVQVAGAVKPVTVKLAGSASDAVVSSLTTVPEVQTSPTVTFAVLSSLKSLFTVNVAVDVRTHEKPKLASQVPHRPLLPPPEAATLTYSWAIQKD